jgi:hypothetical protein
MVTGVLSDCASTRPCPTRPRRSVAALRFASLGCLQGDRPLAIVLLACSTFLARPAYGRMLLNLLDLLRLRIVLPGRPLKGRAQSARKGAAGNRRGWHELFACLLRPLAH